MNSVRRSIFFILGAGASADSGLPTYRGINGLYSNVTTPENILNPQVLCSEDGPEKIWNFLRPIYEEIPHQTPGPTYQKLKELITKFPDSFLLTQNIDGYAKSLEIPVVEIHGNWSKMYCLKCRNLYSTNLENPKCECASWCRPDVVLFGENLPVKELTLIFTLIKTCPEYVIIVGTTLQFPYLRILINKAKNRGSKIIHINPDEKYSENVTRNEQWIKSSAVEGLDTFNRELEEYRK